MGSNNASTTTNGTTQSNENIVVMYPLERDETKSVKSIVSNIEKNKDENLPPEGTENPPTSDPLTTMLMNLQRNLQESNDLHAKEIKTEIGGLKNKIDESSTDMSNKMNGLKTTMDQNAAKFKNEISRIDKRLDDHENKTTNMIEKAIAEAIAANNAKRDAERDAMFESRLRNTE